MEFFNQTEVTTILDLTNESNVTESKSVGLYKIPASLVILLTICYLAVSLCSVFGNSMVLWIVFKSKRMRNVTNFFIANLALADIAIGAFAIPFQFQAALLQKWVLPHFMCSFCPTVQVISLNVSILTLVANSLDRHRAVTRPLKPRLMKRKAIMIIITIWVFSFVLAIPSFLAWEVKFVWNEETKNKTLPFCDTHRISPHLWRTYNHILVIIQYFIPVVIIFITFLHIAIKLSSINETINSRSDSRRALQNKRKLHENKGDTKLSSRSSAISVIKMLFIVTVLFAISWLPYQLYNVLQEIYPLINEYYYINIIWFSCHWLAMSNSCCNPFIYAIYGVRNSINLCN
ncbi:tachykinin-like peptides receptor 99D [Leptotrombidium deliense]|uniref:Tachykinin-like peptides receptor 99D n=1 Tax=Leptotrombidium deliense TaxID=299467 RepID=A0A443SJJ2_9ACAR|nr:tachykinin-like peptides receptor 99D [Leptotrombidium deliense]